MSARPRRAHALQPAERAALERAAEAFVAWKRDWHDGGVAVDPKELAELRKAARAFHKAVFALLGPDGSAGTRARLLVRMQQRELHRHLQDEYRVDLTRAASTAFAVDLALEPDVRRGVKADPLARTWVAIAADHWHEAFGEVPSARIVEALLQFADRRLPGLGGADQVEAAVAMWRDWRKGQ